MFTRLDKLLRELEEEITAHSEKFLTAILQLLILQVKLLEIEIASLNIADLLILQIVVTNELVNALHQLAIVICIEIVEVIK